MTSSFRTSPNDDVIMVLQTNPIYRKNNLFIETPTDRHLDCADEWGATNEVGHEWVWQEEATLLWLLARLMEEQTQPVERAVASVGWLDLVGRERQEAAVDSRPRAILTIKLHSNVGVVELAQLEKGDQVNKQVNRLCKQIYVNKQVSMEIRYVNKQVNKAIRYLYKQVNRDQVYKQISGM